MHLLSARTHFFEIQRQLTVSPQGRDNFSDATSGPTYTIKQNLCLGLVLLRPESNCVVAQYDSYSCCVYELIQSQQTPPVTVLGIGEKNCLRPILESRPSSLKKVENGLAIRLCWHFHLHC